MPLSVATCPEGRVEAIYLNWWQPSLLQRNSAVFARPSPRVAKFNTFETTAGPSSVTGYGLRKISPKPIPKTAVSAMPASHTGKRFSRSLTSGAPRGARKHMDHPSKFCNSDV